MANFRVVFMNSMKYKTWIRVKIVLWKHTLEKVTAFLGKLFRNSNEFPSPPHELLDLEHVNGQKSCCGNNPVCHPGSSIFYFIKKKYIYVGNGNWKH